MNSTLMLACALYTPVSLSSIFNKEDLDDYGVELESHVTLLYAKGLEIPKDNLLSEINIILANDGLNIMDYLKNKDEDNIFKVLDLFELSSFKNDSDYVILKLKQDNEFYKIFKLINKSLRSKYDSKNNFTNYTYIPHITLAKLLPNTSEKYLNSKNLKLILENSYIRFEDFMISYGFTNESVDRKKYNLTTFYAVERYFREEELKKYDKELRDEE